ncbi:hypothetical protein MNV49_000114 [Pseudohyphozyma bogoriensis]|nr:hypothetical protein MNV49_000114 [Pseudohyphozyma bogoriensis]
MRSTGYRISPIVVLALASSAKAQFYGDGNYSNGTSYGIRIGIGVGVALGVALLVMLTGYIMRRRRAKAFKLAYPVNGNGNNGGAAEAGYGGGAQMQQGAYNPGYPQQPSYQEAPPYQQYRPDASGYTPNAYGNQEVPATYQPSHSPAPGTPTYYPPPPGPPPTSESAAPTANHYPPPPGPPPATGEAPPYNVENVSHTQK